MNSIDPVSDASLLISFHQDGNQKSFEVLVERHLDMVFSAAMRRVHNRQLAEEACQNVFLLLSQKAESLSKKSQHLPGWLHLSARYEAIHVMRRESRLKKREESYVHDPTRGKAAEEMQPLKQLLPLLDQAIDKLRPTDRDAIVLRFLENKSLREIGHHLGISEDAAQKRVARALQKMSSFFKRKTGAAVSMTALTSGLFAASHQAAPAACSLACKAFSSGVVQGAQAVLIPTTITKTLIMNKAIMTSAAVLVGAASLPLILSNDKKEGGSETPPAEQSNAQSYPPQRIASSAAYQGGAGRPPKTSLAQTKELTEPTAEQIQQEKIKQLQVMIETSIKEGGEKKPELKVTQLPLAVVQALETLYLSGEVSALEQVENGHGRGEFDFEGKNSDGEKYNFTLRLSQNEEDSEGQIEIIDQKEAEKGGEK